MSEDDLIVAWSLPFICLGFALMFSPWLWNRMGRMKKEKQKKLEAKKLAWLREATGLGEILPDLYNMKSRGFEPNGAGPARVFWGIRLWKVVPDWWPLTVAWKDRSKLSASADYHDLLYFTGSSSEKGRLAADKAFHRCLIKARDEILGWGPVARLRRRRMTRMADLYYVAVRAAGKGSYNWHGPGRGGNSHGQ